jgi:hypothetical protein
MGKVKKIEPDTVQRENPAPFKAAVEGESKKVFISFHLW